MPDGVAGSPSMTIIAGSVLVPAMVINLVFSAPFTVRLAVLAVAKVEVPVTLSVPPMTALPVVFVVWAFTVLANTSSHLRVVDPRRWLSDGSRSLRTCILVRMSIFLIALQITVGVWISDVHVTLSASMSPDTFMVVA
jgi:hypothetical protein